jgi:MscS family membrane protein
MIIRFVGHFILLTGTLGSPLLPGAAPAGPDSASAPAPAPAVVETGLATPRSAAQGFLLAARAARYAEAAHYLDLSQVPREERATQGRLLARELKVVLDQKLWIDLDRLSEQQDGRQDDGLPPERDLVGVIQTPSGAFDIFLRRTRGSSGLNEWRFSPGTLDRVEDVYAEIGYPWLLSWIPEWATRMRVGNIEGWQWIALILLAVVAAFSSRLLTNGVYALVNLLSRRTEPEFRKRLLESIRPPVRLTSTMAVVALGGLYLRLSVPAKQRLTQVAVGLLVALVAWTLLRLVDLVVSRTLDRLHAQGQRRGVSTLVLLRRVAKGIILAVAAVALLQNLGFNVSGLLAGFGIAGAAVALAAQKTIENLFGGLVLAAEQTLRIGDMCRFGNQQGVIEDIGLRATRVRTLDRTVISIPNSEMSSIQIENLTMRDRIRLLTVINLRYETSPEQLTSVLEGLRELLKRDQRVDPVGHRVRFVAIGPYSLGVEMAAYILTRDLLTFLEIQEDLYLRIIKIVSESGTGLALPSQTLYMAGKPADDAGTPAQAPAR